MKLQYFLVVCGILTATPAMAQTAPANANVVASCGTPNGAAYVVGQVRPVTQDTTGKICNG